MTGWDGDRTDAPKAGPLGFGLFLVLTAILFIRPQEWVPGLQFQLYYIAILATLVVCLPGVVRQFRPQTLVASPISACVVGVWVGVVMSHLSHGWFGGAKDSGIEFFQTILYYFLLLAVVDTLPRLRALIWGLVLCLAVVNLIATLEYLEVIDIPSLTAAVQDRRYDEQTGEQIVWLRMVGTGIFSDPNDLSQILVVGMTGCLYLFRSTGSLVPRALALAIMASLVYGLTLTQSRGGLLALLAMMAALLKARFGWTKTIPLFALLVPAVLLLVGGRQAGISGAVASDTGHGRIELWGEGLMLFRQAPVFGIGADAYKDEVEFVAHNSFVHTYTELGMFGGTFFLGAFYCAFWLVGRVAKGASLAGDANLGRLGAYVMAMLVAYSVSLFSLSRPYTIPTYLMLALAAAYVRVAGSASQLPPVCLDAALVRRVGLVSVGTIVALHVFVRVLH